MIAEDITHASLPPKRNLSVLAIDDNRIDLEILKRTLTKCENYTVDFSGYENWERGLDALSEKTADVIFLDYFLEDMTGPELLQTLRSRGDCRPVIMITGSGDESTATESMRFGASDYLSKDTLGPEVLLEAIESAYEDYLVQSGRLSSASVHRDQSDLAGLAKLVGKMARDFDRSVSSIQESAARALGYAEKPVIAGELGQVVERSEDAAKVIQSFYQFSQYYADTNPVTEVDLTRIVTDILPDLVSQCPQRVAIDLQALPENTFHVHGVPSRIRPMIYNLCVNALESMNISGSLRVAARAIRLRDVRGMSPCGLPGGDYICLSVSDTGSGISAAICDTMYRPFSTTKKRGTIKAAGLGLSLVWDCVQTMQGTIHVDSEADTGTTFRIYLPCGTARSVDRTAQSLSSSSNHRSPLSPDTLVYQRPIACGVADHPPHRYTSCTLYRRRLIMSRG